MTAYSDSIQALPSYQSVVDNLSVLELPYQVSYLHGLITALLVCNQATQVENYLRSIILNKSDIADQQIKNYLFLLYSITQTNLSDFGFNFQLLLPNEDAVLPERLIAFVDWNEGFLEGFILAGVQSEDFEDEESLEILQHFEDFSQLDVDEMNYDEEDEKTYWEVVEYARLAVLQLFCEFNQDAQIQH